MQENSPDTTTSDLDASTISRVSPKTAKYLNQSAVRAEEMFSKAVEYRARYDKALTSEAKNYYKNRLTHTIKKLEPYMALFGYLDKINNLKNLQNKSDTPQ